MGRITVLAGSNLTLGTGAVLAALRTAAAGAAAARVKVKRVEIGQSGTTTLEMVRGELATRNTAGTLTTTSATPVNVQPLGGPASGLSGNTSVIGGDARSGINSSADSGGTYTTVAPFAFPNTAGYLYKPAPDEEIWAPASTVFVVRFTATPTGTGGWHIAMVLEEE
jgi:hypothetical protein